MKQKGLSGVFSAMTLCFGPWLNTERRPRKHEGVSPAHLLILLGKLIVEKDCVRRPECDLLVGASGIQPWLPETGFHMSAGSRSVQQPLCFSQFSELCLLVDGFCCLLLGNSSCCGCKIDYCDARERNPDCVFVWRERERENWERRGKLIATIRRSFLVPFSSDGSLTPFDTTKKKVSVPFTDKIIVNFY